MLKKYFLFLLLLLASGSLYSQSLPKAIDFTLNDINGEEITLSDYCGHGPILLSFWATWCKPCKEEMIYLNKLYKKYSPEGFVLFAISVDSERSLSKIKPYVKSHGFRFPVLLDTDGETARNYYARVVPFSVLINKKGEIVWTHTGYKHGDEVQLEEEIKKITGK